MSETEEPERRAELADSESQVGESPSNEEILEDSASTQEAPANSTPEETRSPGTTEGIPSPAGEGADAHELPDQQPEAQPAATENEPSVSVESQSAMVGSHLEKLSADLAEVAEYVQSLHDVVAKRLRYDQTKEDIITRLHSEVQGHRENLYAKMQIPLIKAVVAVWVQMKKDLETIDDENVKQLLDLYCIQIEDALIEQDVEKYSAQPGDEYTPIQQRIIAVEPTDDASLKRTIVKSLQPGFRFNGQVIVPEQVTVYKPE